MIKNSIKKSAKKAEKPLLTAMTKISIKKLEKKAVTQERKTTVKIKRNGFTQTGSARTLNRFFAVFVLSFFFSNCYPYYSTAYVIWQYILKRHAIWMRLHKKSRHPLCPLFYAFYSTGNFIASVLSFYRICLFFNSFFDQIPDFHF